MTFHLEKAKELDSCRLSCTKKVYKFSIGKNGKFLVVKLPHFNCDCLNFIHDTSLIKVMFVFQSKIKL